MIGHLEVARFRQNVLPKNDFRRFWTCRRFPTMQFPIFPMKCHPSAGPPITPKPVGRQAIAPFLRGRCAFSELQQTQRENALKRLTRLILTHIILGEGLEAENASRA